jgi:hypothetical protein
MAKEEEANPPAPSNPDAWQGAEIASAIRGYEAAPPPEVLDAYADNSKEQIEARKKGEEARKKRDAEDAARIKKQEDEAEAKRQRR